MKDFWRRLHIGFWILFKDNLFIKFYENLNMKMSNLFSEFPQKIGMFRCQYFQSTCMIYLICINLWKYEGKGCENKLTQ